jgi:hypothetical protein
MRTLIWLSFITTFLVITVLSVPAALDPALIAGWKGGRRPERWWQQR